MPRTAFGVDTASLIEKWGHQVFVNEPRLFIFSHRSLASIRHPHWSIVLNLDEKVSIRLKRHLQRTERISEFLSKSSYLYTVAYDKWKVVAELFDSKASEHRISMLRNQVVECYPIRVQLEVLWASYHCSASTGLAYDQYFNINSALYSILLGGLDLTPLHSIISEAIKADWQTDSNGSDVVNFGQFCLSMLEVIDNWCPTGKVDHYVQLAEEILPMLMGEVSPPAKEDRSQESRSREWEDTVKFLMRNAATFLDPPLVRATHTLTNDIIYVKVDDGSSLTDDERLRLGIERCTNET